MLFFLFFNICAATDITTVKLLNIIIRNLRWKVDLYENLLKKKLRRRALMALQHHQIVTCQLKYPITRVPYEQDRAYFVTERPIYPGELWVGIHKVTTRSKVSEVKVKKRKNFTQFHANCYVVMDAAET